MAQRDRSVSTKSFCLIVVLSALSVSMPLRQFRIGGRKQRASARQSARSSSDNQPVLAASHVLTSNLTRHLITQWAWGVLSAAQIQAIAQAAHQDQLAMVERCGVRVDNCDEDTKKMGSLGQHGQRSGNLRRDLMVWIGQPGMPEPCSILIETKIQKVKRVMLLSGMCPWISCYPTSSSTICTKTIVQCLMSCS